MVKATLGSSYLSGLRRKGEYRRKSFTFDIMSRSKFLYPALLALFWVLMILIVNPIGNFPLNDDWIYARPVWYIINKGYFLTTDSYSPVFAAQVLWGSLFCLPCGFSFTALRISVLVLGLAGVLVLYFLVNSISGNRKLAFTGALLLLINPLYFSLSNTFMTDVPFLVFALISIFAFIKTSETPKIRYLVIATFSAIVATLIRQFGIIIPIAYSIAILLKQKPKLKFIGIYLLPPIITASALLLTILWLNHLGSGLHPYGAGSATDFLDKPGDFVSQLFVRSGFLIFYTGFFLLPYTLYSGNYSFSLRNILVRKNIVGFILITIFLPSLIHAWRDVIHSWDHVPTGFILNSGSIGPPTLRDTKYAFVSNIKNLPNVSGILSLICFCGAILLLFRIGTILTDLYKEHKSANTKSITARQYFIIGVIFGYAFLMFTPSFFFDRYLLIFTPLFFLLICRQTRPNRFIKIPAIMSSLIIIVMALFSVLCTHDYLAWNRSRWDAWNYATHTLMISPHHIEGGYECKGWVLGTQFDPHNNYLLSFGPLKGCDIVKAFPYQNYFPYETRDIYILHRKSFR